MPYPALIENYKLHIKKDHFNDSALLNYRTARALIKVQKQIKRSIHFNDRQFDSVLL